ncbi:MAG: DNA internalization-related competence protein ComEC/Rec2 [Pseudomonadota bacterium]
MTPAIRRNVIDNDICVDDLEVRQMVVAAVALVAAIAWDQGMLSAPVAISILGVIYVTHRQKRTGRILIPAVIVGVCLSAQARQVLQLQQWSPDAPVISATTIRLLQTPRVTGGSTGFIAATYDRELPRRLRVRWFAPPELSSGQCWRVTLEFLPVAKQRSSLRELSDHVWGIGAEARVRGSASLVQCGAFTRAVAFLRDRVRLSLRQALPTGNPRAVLLALTLGERNELSEPLLREFQRTGLSHLMAISGLHIGLAASVGFLCLRWCATPLARVSQDFGWVGALLSASLYALLSGFGLPAQRALLATVLLALSHWQRTRVDLARLVALAAAFLLCIDPNQFPSASFLMSFGAVALLSLLQFVVRRRYRTASGWHQTVLAQCCLSLVLGVATGAFFGVFSWGSLPMNLVLIPWFGFVVVPAMLASALSALLIPELATVLWPLVSMAVEPALFVTSFTSATPFAASELATVSTGVISTIVAASLWVTISGLPGRCVALVALGLLFIVRPAPPATGCIVVHAHSVGHGLAMTVRAGSDTVVYDAGPRWRGGDTGQRVLLPFLQEQGIATVTMAIVSHGDMDHIGGFWSLQQGIPVEHWLGTDTWPCNAGQRWRRFGTTYTVLWPVPDLLFDSDNDRSCVLLVETRGGARVLLPGDIEARAEREVVMLYGLRSDLVIVPHHGSRTSSSKAFVGATRPLEGWVSNAQRKGWQMPHPVVVENWSRAGTRLRETAISGRLMTRMCESRRRTPTN